MTVLSLSGGFGARFRRPDEPQTSPWQSLCNIRYLHSRGLRFINRPDEPQPSGFSNMGEHSDPCHGGDRVREIVSGRAGFPTHSSSKGSAKGSSWASGIDRETRSAWETRCVWDDGSLGCLDSDKRDRWETRVSLHDRKAAYEVRRSHYCPVDHWLPELVEKSVHLGYEYE